MESSTLAVVLALTLACTGGMFLVIAQQIRGRSGMATFALGLALFGLVFAVPDASDRDASLPLGVVIDTLAVAAVLLLRRGLQRFMHRPEGSWRNWVAQVVAFAVVAAILRALIGPSARPLTLDVALVGLFVVIHKRTPGLPLVVKLSGALSMLAWFLVIIFGRFIAYDWFYCEKETTTPGSLMYVLQECDSALAFREGDVGEVIEEEVTGEEAVPDDGTGESVEGEEAPAEDAAPAETPAPAQPAPGEGN